MRNFLPLYSGSDFVLDFLLGGLPGFARFLGGLGNLFHQLFRNLRPAEDRVIFAPHIGTEISVGGNARKGIRAHQADEGHADAVLFKNAAFAEDGLARIRVHHVGGQHRNPGRLLEGDQVVEAFFQIQLARNKDVVTNAGHGVLN